MTDAHERIQPSGPPATAIGARINGYRDVPHRGMIFLIAALGLLMASIDQTIVATGLDTIGAELHASVTWAGWTITIYAVGIVLALPVAGRLTDRVGHRRVLLVSIGVFTGASLCCGLATNIYLLVGLRAVQAIGGAGFTPAATGIILNNFGSARDKALGLFGSILPVGAMIGPIIGGVLISTWSWRGIFLVNVPIGLILIALCLRFVPRTHTSAQQAPRRQRLDMIGIVLLGVAVLSGMAGAVQLGEPGQQLWSASILAPEAGALVAFAVLIGHLRRAADPLVPPQLLAGRGFGPVNLLNFMFGVSVSGLGALIPLYAADRYGLSALKGGVLLTGRGIAVIVFSAVAVALMRRTGYRWPLLAGCLLIAIGTAGLAAQPIGLSNYTWLAVAAAITGVGAGCSNPASRNASLQLAPHKSALIASLRRMSRQLGSIASVSITTAIVAQSARPGQAMAHVLFVFAITMIAVTPLISRVPEHYGAW